MNTIQALRGLFASRLHGRTMLAVFLATVLVFSATGSALAGTIGAAQGFEDDDGNLVVDSTFDWNGFSPATWTGTAPTRQAIKTANGFNFLGLEDYQATTSDTGFAGGTKQDANCPSVITQKADNKADLKRIYIASKNIGGEVYLDLAWVRIPQNTTAPSAHVAFEFNQGTTPCGPASDGLVQRTAGDMLIVYDFEGGSADTPHITLRRWVTSGACEISSDSAPCWGLASDLTTLGFAEAKVNTTAAALDTVAPSNETLGINEFGEAGLDLGPNGANIFPANQCVSFGKAFGVSRTSGNSGTAQMKDLVGPGTFRLSNCGTITIIKQTDPRGANQDFSYTTTGGLSPASFTLNDSGNAGKTLGSTLPADNSAGNTRTYSNVLAGAYSVTEGSDPAGFVFDSLTCSATGSGTSTTTSGKTASIALAGDGTVTCLYINKQQRGAIQVTKQSVKGNAPLAGATFSVVGTGFTATLVTNSNGTACVDNLAFGSYTVTETAAPSGYKIDNPNGVTVTVDHNATCSSGTPNAPATFTDTPLSQIEVKFTSLAGAGVTNASIVCASTSATVDAVSENGSADPAFDDTDETFTNLISGTYTCTVVVDP